MPLANERVSAISSTIATASATAMVASAFAARPSVLWAAALVVCICVLMRSAASLRLPENSVGIRKEATRARVRDRDPSVECAERSLHLRFLRFRPVDVRPQGVYRLSLRVYVFGERVCFTDAAGSDVFLTDAFVASDGATVELGTAAQCQVQLPVQVEGGSVEPPLRAEVSLHFAAAAHHSEQPADDSFEEVGAEVLLLRRTEDGLGVSCAVVFDEANHFGVVEIQTLTAPLGPGIQEDVMQEVALPFAFPRGGTLCGLGAAPPRLYQRAAGRAREAFDCSPSSDEGTFAPPLPKLLTAEAQVSGTFIGSMEVEELPSMSGWAGPVVFFEDRCVAHGSQTMIEPASGEGEEEKVAKTEEPADKTGIHLLVIVPDTGGSALDVRPLRNHLAAALPHAVLFVSSDADGAAPAGSGVRRRRMAGGLDVLQRRGVALAEEVSERIKTLPQPGLARLSFVAVSCGGLVVRAALPWLRSYSSSCCTLVTIGTPHLGRFPGRNFLKAALYGLARAWPCGTKLPCVEQLQLEDGRAPENGFLYKLSREPCLKSFRAAVLIGAVRDWRAPPEKALVEEREVGPTEKRSLSNPACMDMCTPAGRRWWYMWWWWFRWFDIPDMDGMMAQRMLSAGPGPSPVPGRSLLLLRVRVATPWISLPWASEANRLIRSRHFLRTFVRRYSVLMQ